MSGNHSRIGSGWRPKHDANQRDLYGHDEGECYYAGLMPGKCQGVPNQRLDRHHVIELQDGGHPEDTVSACRRHHEMVTQQNRSARSAGAGQRTAARTGQGSRGRPVTTGQPEQGLGLVAALHVYAVGASVAGAGVLMMTGHDRWIRWVVAAWVAYLAVAAYAVATRRRRDAVRGKLVAHTVQTMKVDPDHVKLSAMRWGFDRRGRWAEPRAGKVSFPRPELARDPGTRKRVEETWRQTLGAGVTWPAVALEPHFAWRVGEAAEVQPTAVDEPAADDQHAELCSKIAEGLRTSLKVTPKDRDKVAVTVEASDGDGPLRIRVDYPDSVKDEGEEFAPAVVAKVTAKGPKGMRWRAEPDTQANAVVLHRRPPLPEKIDNPMGTDADPGRGLPWHVLPFGDEESGEVAAIDVKRQPHSLFAGKTRTGKTVTCRTCMIRAAANGFDVYAVDPKQIEFDGLEAIPGIRVFADDQENVSAVEIVHAEMKRRYSAKHQKLARLDSHRPVLLVIDEYQEFCEVSLALHLAEPGAKGKEAPAVGMVKSIARLGAAANIFLLLLTQRSDADWFSGVLRENMGNRLASGRLSPQASAMAFDRTGVGRDVPPIKGRSTYTNPDGQIVELQSWWTPNPEDEKLTEADRVLTDRLIEACKNRKPWGDASASATAPLPLEAGPMIVDLDELALMLEDCDWVEVVEVESGEFFKVVEVCEGPEITYLLADGSHEVLGLDDDSVRFEVRSRS